MKRARSRQVSGQQRAAAPWRERDDKVARNLAEVIDELYDKERPRPHRIKLIAVHVMSAIKNGFKRGREYERWKNADDVK
jgi:hypothetical protein